MTDISDVLKRAKPRERTVELCIAGDVAAEVERLEAELARVSADWRPDSLAANHPGEAIAKKIAAARERMREAEVPFTFRALGAKAWSDLVAQHPAKTEGQAFDPETFSPALLAACCVDPVMTVDQVTELLEVLNTGQVQELVDAAYEVNTESTAVPFSLAASAILASSGRK
ncbi:hypothetical protein [Streptomyces sp. bgisy154]|uniref:hypothetical protein n=1 Tax=Streptomyces sp. bgisy154 TaxID=3413794 RepID=UPI003D75C61E